MSGLRGASFAVRLGGVYWVLAVVGGCNAISGVGDYEFGPASTTSTASGGGGATPTGSGSTGGTGGTAGLGGGGTGGTGGGGAGGGPVDCGYIDALADDFADGIKADSVWWDDDTDGGAAYEDVGAFVVELDADYSEAYFGTEYAYDLTERTITIEIEQVTLAGSQSLWFVAGDGYSFDNRVEMWAEDGELFFGRHIGGAQQDIAPEIAFDPISMRLWRFRERARALRETLETSGDGASWQPGASTPSNLYDICYTWVAVGAEGDGEGSTGYARIDSVEGGGPRPAFCARRPLSPTTSTMRRSDRRGSPGAIPTVTSRRWVA